MTTTAQPDATRKRGRPRKPSTLQGTPGDSDHPSPPFSDDGGRVRDTATPIHTPVHVHDFSPIQDIEIVQSVGQYEDENGLRLKPAEYFDNDIVAEKKSEEVVVETTAPVVPEKTGGESGWMKVGDKGNGKVVVSAVPSLENVPVSVIGARAMKEMVMDGVGVELAGCRALPDKLYERFANEFISNGQDCERAVAKVWGAQVKQKKRQGFGQDLLKRYDVGARIRYIRDEKMVQESGYGMVVAKGVMLKELAEMIKGNELKAGEKLKAMEMIARFVGYDKPKTAGGAGGGGQVIKVVTGVRGDPDTGAAVGDGEKDDLIAPDEDDDDGLEDDDDNE